MSFNDVPLRSIIAFILSDKRKFLIPEQGIETGLELL